MKLGFDAIHKYIATNLKVNLFYSTLKCRLLIDFYKYNILLNSYLHTCQSSVHPIIRKPTYQPIVLKLLEVKK